MFQSAWDTSPLPVDANRITIWPTSATRVSTNAWDFSQYFTSYSAQSPPPYASPYFHPQPYPSPRFGDIRRVSSHTRRPDNQSRPYSPEYAGFSPRSNSNGFYATPAYDRYVYDSFRPVLRPTSHGRRVCTSIPSKAPQRPQKVPMSKAKAEVRKHYFLKYWDPSEEPILLGKITIDGTSCNTTSLDMLQFLLGKSTSLLPSRPKPSTRIRRPMTRRKILRVNIKEGEHFACPDSGSEQIPCPKHSPYH